MAEIEIRTDGELRLAGEVVGQVVWVRPFIERDVAGTYDDEDALLEQYCSGCEEKNSTLDDAQRVVERALERITKCEAEAARIGLSGDIPHHLEQVRRDLEALDLEP